MVQEEGALADVFHLLFVAAAHKDCAIKRSHLVGIVIISWVSGLRVEHSHVAMSLWCSLHTGMYPVMQRRDASSSRAISVILHLGEHR